LEAGKPCPVCGSIHHTISVEKIDRKVLLESKKKKTNLELVLKSLNESINNLSIRLISYEKEEETYKNELMKRKKVVRG
jgi:exonuclease SbcC